MRDEMSKWIGGAVMLIGATLLVLGLMRFSGQPEMAQSTQTQQQENLVVDELQDDVAQEQQIRALEQAQRDRTTREQQAQIAEFQLESGLVDITLGDEDPKVSAEAAQSKNQSGLIAEAGQGSVAGADRMGESSQALTADSSAQAQETPAVSSDADALSAAVNRLAQARRAPAEGGNRVYSVQASLAPTMSQAQQLAARLKSKGYAVALSQTDSGVRVLVGPEKNKASALALKDVINAEPDLRVNGAWVNRVSKGLFKAESATKPASSAATTKTPSPAATKAPAADTQASVAGARAAPAKPADNAASVDRNNGAVISKSKPLNNYRVQVALAADQARADELVARLNLNGFSASSAPEGPGVRVTVGGNFTQSQAASIQRQINQNTELGVSGAWIRAD